MVQHRRVSVEATCHLWSSCITVDPVRIELCHKRRRTPHCREVSFASWVKLGQDFDLKRFTGSFSRVADFSAWYPSGKAAEQAPVEDEQAGSGVEVCWSSYKSRLAKLLFCMALSTFLPLTVRLLAGGGWPASSCSRIRKGRAQRPRIWLLGRRTVVQLLHWVRLTFSDGLCLM